MWYSILLHPQIANIPIALQASKTSRAKEDNEGESRRDNETIQASYGRTQDINPKLSKVATSIILQQPLRKLQEASKVEQTKVESGAIFLPESDHRMLQASSINIWKTKQKSIAP